MICCAYFQVLFARISAAQASNFLRVSRALRFRYTYSETMVVSTAVSTLDVRVCHSPCFLHPVRLRERQATGAYAFLSCVPLAGPFRILTGS